MMTKALSVSVVAHCTHLIMVVGWTDGQMDLWIDGTQHSSWAPKKPCISYIENSLVQIDVL